MGDGVVQLSSKSHPESILGSLHQLRLQGQLSDITVHVSDQGDEEDFQAHQVILAASSGYFKKILLSPDSAPPTNPVVLNMHTTDFSNFLDFVYTGKVEVPRDKVDGVREAASLLECEDLLEVCSRVLQAEELKDTEQTSSLSPSHDTEGLHNTGKKKLTKRGTLKRQRSPRTSGRLGCKKLKQMDIGHEETSPDKVGIRRLSIRVARRHASVGTKRGKIKETSREQYEYSQGTTDRGQGDGADSPSRAEREEDEGLLVPSVSWDVVDGDNREEEEEEDEHVPEDDPGDPLYLSLDDEKEEDAPTTSRRSSKAQFYCDNCQRSFHYERSYLKHISTYHGEKTEVIYRCETCQQTFANRGNLKIHEKHVHSDERLFACQVCSKSFKRKKDVVRHQRMVHEGGGQRHICPDCGKTLSSKTALTLHERTHTGAKPYECLKCGARFTQRSALKMHNRTHTGEKPFACDQCDARFTQKHMLCYHKRSHTGEKPFMCEACGKSFASKEYLRHHSNIHTGSKPHKCDLCGRGFAQRNSLHQHLKIHTGERPYSCKECDKQFTQLNALQRHQRIHTGEKPYMCGLCNRTFTDKSTVRRHTMTHDTDAPWKSYLVVLEGNVEGKKPKVSPKVKADKSEGQELKAEVAASGAKAQTEAVAVPAEPVAISADWANPGTIALVSHNALGSFTVIQTEMPPGTQLQPLVTTDGTGASVISLDGSAISVPFSLPVSMAHSIPVSSSSISVPVSLTVPVSEAILASGTPPVSTAPLLETAETIPDSVVEAAAANKAGVVDPDIKTVITPGKEDSVKQPPAIPGDEQQRPPEEMSTGEAASEESPEDAV